MQQETCDRYQERIKTLKQDVMSRDSAVQALKAKVAELYVDFQTTNQNKILSENEVSAAASQTLPFTSPSVIAPLNSKPNVLLSSFCYNL